MQETRLGRGDSKGGYIKIGEKYTSRVIQFADLKEGKLVNRVQESYALDGNGNPIVDADVFDVDYIVPQKGQTFVNSIFVGPTTETQTTRYNIDLNDKNAMTPNPSTDGLAGKDVNKENIHTIKLRAGTKEGVVGATKNDVNKGNVTISGTANALQISATGKVFHEPSVDYGKGIPHK